MAISERDIEHIFERLRSGVVPERGLEIFAVGIDKQRTEIHRQLQLAADREGVFKFLRGGYGCGKTFMSRLAILDAQVQGFATSFVVVSDNDLQFYKFDDVYRKVVQELGTSSCARSALSDIIDRWIARVEDALIAGGANENSDEFDDQVQQRMEEELASLTGGKAPEDMARVLRTIFSLKQKGEIAEASALLSWLSGSENVAASAKKVAGIKGDIGSRDALDYLHGVLEIVKASGYKGLVIVIDEVETVLRMRHDSRGKSLNGIRQICDAADRYKGLLWIFTGTPEFFDTKRGVAGLEPLSERIQFLISGGFANPRQPQLELKPFDANRLKEVALKLREIYPTANRNSLINKITSDFIERLVAKVTAGFKGDVGVVPRQFLRQFVNVLDLVAENEDFNPMTAEGFEIKDLNEDEQRINQGHAYFDEDPADAKGYAAIEF
ncbi:BREX system ATP-binding protein BrxD [Tychonema sp. LEGE 07199]|uniref:BREX system ATP-binding protein BrxD n=1 Tax=unclassified Tychonema TaxID=2642144 RepID=UPI0018818B02|nr:MULTISPECIES: BREX system ATP-binding protein BrxD [unclassified Tychonema]MBE9119518.1 BREX system ATP-binding protein BrxD [Tychonema sp. LEGE 07199]MBE9130710.1 BREX system ATP-binding protein BrxD [Tychonema sp. LEGE 07196]